MHGDPALWQALLDRLADLAIASLRSQIEHGARAVQLFDSWAGALSPAHYERFVLPASSKVFAALADLDVPRIHFGVDTGELLGLFVQAGADVVGVDWRTPLSAARARTGRSVRAAGQPRSGRLLRTVGRRRGRSARGPRRQRRPSRSRLQPRSRRAARHRPVDPRAGRRPRAPRRDRARDVSTGVVVMAYGTPASAEDLAAYYTHIRRGRPPSDEQIAELRTRYDAIGGMSPLRRITEAQRDRIAAALGRRLSRSRSGTSTRRRSSRTPSPRCGRRTCRRSSASCSRRTTAAARSASTSSDSGPTRRRSDRGTTCPSSSRSRRTRSERPSRRCRRGRASCSPRTRCPSGCSKATSTSTSWRRPPRASPRRRVSMTPTWIDRVAVGGADARAVAGTRHRRGARSTRLGAGRRRRARVPAGVHGGPPRGAVRPRRRGPPAGRRRSGWTSGARAMVNDDAEVLDRAGRRECERWRHEAGRRRRRRHLRPGGRLRVAAPAAGRVDRRPRGVRPVRRQGGHVAVRRPPGRRGRRRVPRPGAVGTRPVPRARDRDDARVAGRFVRVRVVGRRAAAAPRRARARRADRSRRGQRVGHRRRTGCRCDRPVRRSAAGADISVGALVRPQLGDAVFERLVDPAARRHQRGRRRPAERAGGGAATGGCGRARSRPRRRLAGGGAARAAGPVFYAPVNGMGAIVDALVDWLRSHGVELRLESHATADGVSADADGVVVALPAHAASAALARVAPASASELARIEYASVALVTLAFSPSSVHRPLDGSGFLVPRTDGLAHERVLVDVEQVGAPGGRRRRRDVIVRVSTGRLGDERFAALDDDTLVARLLEELAATSAIEGQPREVRVQPVDAVVPAVRARPSRPGRPHRTATGRGGAAHPRDGRRLPRPRGACVHPPRP